MKKSLFITWTSFLQYKLFFVLFLHSVCFTLSAQTQPQQSPLELFRHSGSKVQEERAQRAAFECLYATIKDSVKTFKIINEIKLKNKNLTQPEILFKISEYRDSIEKARLATAPRQFDESTLIGEDFWTSKVISGYDTCYVVFEFKKDKTYSILTTTMDCAGIVFLETEGRWSLKGNVLSMGWKVVNFNTGREEEVECKSTLKWITNKSFKQKILSHPNGTNIGKEREFLAEFIPHTKLDKTCRACSGSGQISCWHPQRQPNDNSWRCLTCNNTGYSKCNACNGSGHH